MKSTIWFCAVPAGRLQESNKRLEQAIKSAYRQLTGEDSQFLVAGFETRYGERVWQCKIGTLETMKLPWGSDWPMRNAAKAAYFETVGEHPEFISSGWGQELSEAEKRQVCL